MLKYFIVLCIIFCSSHALSIQPIKHISKTYQGGSGNINYQCKRCGLLLKANHKPSSLGCINSKMHEWFKLGKIGTYYYICKHCGTMITSVNRPSSLGCPVKDMHCWYKLSKKENSNTYICTYCGATIESRSIPSSLGCPANSSHNWIKSN